MAMTAFIHSPHTQGFKGLRAVDSLGLSHWSLSWLGVQQANCLYLTCKHLWTRGMGLVYLCTFLSLFLASLICCSGMIVHLWESVLLQLCIDMFLWRFTESLLSLRHFWRHYECRMHLDWSSFPYVSFHRQICPFHPLSSHRLWFPSTSPVNCIVEFRNVLERKSCFSKFQWCVQLKSASIQSVFMKNFGLICSLCKHASALQNRKDWLLFYMHRARLQGNFILCMYKKYIYGSN